jgi:membrane peptidoglycan carboxypeptidase
VAAHQTWSALKEALDNGTGSLARSAYGLRQGEFAGKTSTAYNFTDNWFIGSSDKLTCGVWCGYDRPKPIFEGAFSNETILPVWVDVMNAAAEKWKPAPPAPPPASLAKKLAICRTSGQPAGDYCYDLVPDPKGGKPRLVSTTYAEYVKPGTVVEGRCELHQKDSELLAGLLAEPDGPAEAPDAGASLNAVIPEAPVLVGEDPYESVQAPSSKPQGPPVATPVLRPRVVGEEESGEPPPVEEPARLSPLPRPGKLELSDE